MHYDSYCFSSAGGRSYNEDSVGTRELPDGKLYILADGQGGQARGEIASGIVVQTFTELPYEAGCDAQAWLREGLAEASSRVDFAQEMDGCTMHSTAVVLLLQENQAHWAHIGDSRLYYLHGGSLCSVTEDHASSMHTIGDPAYDQPDSVSFGELSEGDAFLLCSDGMWTYLKNAEIGFDLLKSRTAKEWSEHLLLRVMERVCPDNDNLSLIAILVSGN